jgi:hypothetical protein
MRIGYGEFLPGRRLPERAAFVAAVLGVTMGPLFLFAPIHVGCMTTATSTVPGQIATPGPTVCRSESLAQRQVIWPLPFLAVVVCPWRNSSATWAFAARWRVREAPRRSSSSRSRSKRACEGG